MSRLLLITTPSGVTVPPVLPDEDDLRTSADRPLPYRLPTDIPYNVRTWCETPGPYQNPVSVHPSVWDFGPDGWNDYRYWFVHTPWDGNALENPVLLVSNNPWAYRMAPGAPAPLDGPAGGGSSEFWHLSDPDLWYDADEDTLHVFYRESMTANGENPNWEKIWVVSTQDGHTFTEPVEIIEITGAGNDRQVLAPGVFKHPETGVWWLYAAYSGRRWSAPEAAGTWTEQSTYTVTGGYAWHWDVIYDEGQWRGIDGSTVYVSEDGVTWRKGAEILPSRPGEWDKETYRSSMFPHQDGESYHVWYSSDTTYYGWHTAYTIVPKDHWRDA